MLRECYIVELIHACNKTNNIDKLVMELNRYFGNSDYKVLSDIIDILKKIDETVIGKLGSDIVKEVYKTNK